MTDEDGPAPKAVVFDIGNVLVEWQPERFYDAVIGADRRRALFAQVDLARMNAQVDLGAPFAETVHDLADATPAWRDEILLWHDRWIEMASPAIDRSVRLMGALQAGGVPVFSLTNFGVQTYDIAAAHYPFLRRFDHDFISGHMRVAKPDPEIYAQLERVTGMAGSDLIFTDDRPDNIAVAQARGWQTHHFDGPAGWATRLVQAGLLTKENAA